MPLIEIDNEKLNGIDAFPLSFTAQEHLSQDPVYRLTFQVPDPDLDIGELLGEKTLISVEQPDQSRRTFTARVVAGGDEGQHQDQYVYQLELRSWLWFLMQNRNCRIFQHRNVLTIIEEIFTRYSVADYRIETEGTYPDKEYCVQFGESDFSFVSRLMEDAGLWYYIDHSDNRDVMVITDHQQFKPLSDGYDSLSFLPDSEEHRAIREGIQRIRRNRRIHASEVVLRDFDFLKPRHSLQTQAEEKRPHLQGIPLEWYDYAAGYDDVQQGEVIARKRLEAFRCENQILQGESNATGLKPGHTFELNQHPDSTRNRGFKVLGCDYTFIQDGPDSSSTGRRVSCRFRALNDDEVYRPLCRTPRPQIPGIQSATVVGAPDSEVHTDKYARIRVHFHWDRYKTTEEDSSCWIRVIQAWAGKGWGVLAMPRVGQEVLVTYIDGDLDRPMVTGIVYNGENPPPYQLPEHINYSGLVSRSLRHGMPQHASQITFDDKRYNERVMIHAERDMQYTVERNSAATTGQDRYEVVKRTATDWFKNHVSYKDVNFSFTGFNFSATGTNVGLTGLNINMTGAAIGLTGVNTSFTGVNTSFTGVNTSFTGQSTSFTGSSDSSTGVSNSRTGVSTSFTGTSNSITGSSHSITGLSTGITGCSASQTGQSYSATGSSLSHTGVSVSTTGSSTSNTGVSVSTTGSSTSVTGVSVSTTGSSTSVTGSSVSAVGSSVSATGSSVGVKGSDVSATGSSVSTTGSDISAKGSSMSVTGFSFSYTGASYSDTGIDLKTVGMQSKN